MMFFVVIFGILAGNVVWWLWADRAARRMLRPRLCRGLIVTFELLALGYVLLFIIVPVAARRPSPWVPMQVIAAMYVWHLLFMPMTVVLITLTSLARYLSFNRQSQVANPKSEQPHVDPEF